MKRRGMEDLIKKAGKIRKNGHRVEAVFNRALEEISEGKKPNLNQIQREEGYSEESIRCNKVFQTKTWEQMKGKDLENFVRDGFVEIASPDNLDKRTRLGSLKEMAELLDLYPGKKLKIESFNNKTSEFFD